MTELDRETEEVYEQNVSSEEARFDATMGALEEILMSEGFSRLQTNFCKDNCGMFEDSDENTHEYYDVFAKYSQIMEKFIEDALHDKISGFCMKDFTQMLVAREDEAPGDVLDLLLGLSDFVEFKQMMLAFKAGEPLDFVVTDYHALSSPITTHK